MMDISLFKGLTSGEVAGLIAVGIFIVQILFSFVWPLILVAILSTEETAVTWSVVARILHNSYWPTVLRSDASASQGVRRKVTFLVWAIILTTGLVTVASIVTPLGLYETIAPDKVSTLIDFHYVKDTSALGAGTPPRPSLGFSRICRGGDLACPNSGQDVTVVNVTSSSGINFTDANAPYGYDTRIPKRYFDFLESGVSGSRLNRSVSSAFDIQWRTWTTTALNATDVLGEKNSSFYNNGSAYALGTYRSLTNVLLDDAWEVIEGLIVDSKNGGVGFRNHTMPSQPLQYGAQWSEDILFIEPVTECVNLNVSLDFSLTTETYSPTLEITSARLVDHGGFVDFDRNGLPFIAIGNQTDPLLVQRAQTGAWITNMLMMLVWNVTDRQDSGSVTVAPPFTYLNSQKGKEFPLPTNQNDKKPAATYLTSYNSLLSYSDLSTFFSTLTPLPESWDANSTSNVFNYTQLPPNPYMYQSFNMTPYGQRCTGILYDDSPGFHIVGGACGVVMGVPRRKDNSETILFEPNTEWTLPMYSCASATRATIKTVDFGYNTSTTLAGLSVRDIRPKSYPNASAYPLWASETGQLPDWFLRAMQPLWGIVDKKDDSMQNIEYTQAPHLWLSASVGSVGFGYLTDNLPAGEFHGLGLFHAYGVNTASTTSTSGVGDYSGRANLPMYNQWKNLSSTATGSALIINLIWTDIAANAVVGTRSWLPTADAPNLAKRDDASSTAQVPIHVLSRSTKYHFQYAIPAFLVLALLLLALSASFLSMVFGRGTLGRIRMYLSRVSSGRLMTTIVEDDTAMDETVGVSSSSSVVSTRQWLKRQGTMVIDVSERVPRAKGVEKKYETEKIKARPSQENLYYAG